MQNFLVLGYIPGTQIQITFGMWLWLMVSLLSGYALAQLYVHRQPVINLYVYLTLRRLFRRQRLLLL